MTKRFGRQQKRKLREEIKRLKENNTSLELEIGHLRNFPGGRDQYGVLIALPRVLRSRGAHYREMKNIQLHVTLCSLALDFHFDENESDYRIKDKVEQGLSDIKAGMNRSFNEQTEIVMKRFEQSLKIMREQND